MPTKLETHFDVLERDLIKRQLMMQLALQELDLPPLPQPARMHTRVMSLQNAPGPRRILRQQSSLLLKQQPVAPNRRRPRNRLRPESRLMN